jgi:hypothetical protein
MHPSRAAISPTLSLAVEACRWSGAGCDEPECDAMQPIGSHGVAARPASSVQRLIDRVSKFLAGRAAGACLAAPPREDRQRRPRDVCLEYGPAVYRRCLRMLGDEQAACEATQAILVAVARDVRMLQTADDPAAILKRVYRAATNHCVHMLEARDYLVACGGAL